MTGVDDREYMPLRQVRVAGNLSTEQAPQAEIHVNLEDENIRRTKCLIVSRKHIYWVYAVLGTVCAATIVLLLWHFTPFNPKTSELAYQSQQNLPFTPTETEKKADIFGPYEKAAARLLALQSDEFHPCQDFHQFSCGNSGENGSLIKQMVTDNRRDIKSLLEGLKGQHELKALENVKQFYDSCMQNPDAGNSTSGVLSIIQSKLGQWPILQGAEWEHSEHGLEKLLAQLFAHEVQNIFRLRIIPAASFFVLFFQSGKPAVSENFFLNRSNSTTYQMYMDHYRILLIRLVGILLPEKEWDSEVMPDVVEMLRFEAGFARILESSKCALEGSEGFDKEVNTAINADITLGDIQEQLPLVNFTVLVRDIFNILGVKGEVSNNMPVVLMCPEFFFKLVALVKLIDSRTLTNYLIWRFIFRYLPYMGGEFHNVWRVFAASVPLSIEKAELPHYIRYQQCVSMANQEFGLAIGHMYVKQNHEKCIHAEAIGEEISRYLKAAFIQVIEEKQWIDLYSKRRLIKKLKDTKITIGDPTFFESVGVLQQEYGGLEFNSSDFIQQILEIKRFKTAASMRKRPAPHYTRILKTPVVATAFHIQRSNEIVIPLGALRYPLIDESYPMYVNFANMGFILAHELAHGLVYTTWWPEDVDMSIVTRQLCFASQYSKFKIPGADIHLDGIRTLEENIADNAALRVSWLAYEMWAKNHTVEGLLPGVSLSIPQIFYVTFGQMWCEVLDKSVYNGYYTSDSHSPGMFRVLGAIHNDEKFAKSFDCHPGSPMNPSHKCSLW